MDALQFAVAAAFLVLALLSVRLRRRHPTPPTAWLAATFVVLALALIAARIVPLLPPDAGAVVQRVLRVGVVAFPYLLFRFTVSLQPASRGLVQGAGVLAGTAVVLTALAPQAPTDGPPSAGYLAYVGSVVVMWTVLTSWVVWWLWRSGTREPAVARRRVRTLALGAAVLNVALVLAGLGAATDVPPAVATAIQVGALASAVLFYVGFAPPGILRQMWRRADERALWEAEGELMAATSSGEVASCMLPHVSRLLGGGAALFRDASGEESAHGAAPEDLRRWLADSERGGEGPLVTDQFVVLDLHRGRLGVVVGPTTPLFGDEEVELLVRLGTLMDLALTRSESYDREQAARARAEATTAELESLVYGLSHDLRRPIVSVRGYVDCLAEDYGHVLAGDGTHFLARLRANVAHMDDLIGDLLQLSRVGRVDERPEAVDLTAVVGQVTGELARQYPAATIEVGSLPVVLMDPGRASQLFTNLLANALAHSGRPDVTVRVSAVGAPGGVAVADNGRGIPVPDRERVFNLFERLDSDSGQDQGTGVGLAMCRRIVEHAGGRIWIADSDQGTDVRVQLPLATPEQPTVTDDGARSRE